MQMRAKDLGGLLGAAAARFLQHEVPRMGAALAYYTAFSLAPLLVVITAVAGAVLGSARVQAWIVEQLSGMVSRDGAAYVEGVLKAAADGTGAGVAAVVSAVVLFVGATTAAVNLRAMLNFIWGVTPTASASVWTDVRAFLRTRATTLLVVLGVGLLLMVLVVGQALIEGFIAVAESRLPIPGALLQLLNQIVSLAVSAVLFAYVFRALPDVRLPWRDVALGAAVTAVLFTVGKYAIGLYLGRAGVASAYGAAGAFALLLVWLYLSAQVVLFGAELTIVYAERYGAHLRPRTGYVLRERASEASPTPQVTPLRPPAPPPVVGVGRPPPALPGPSSTSARAAARPGWPRVAAAFAAGWVVGRWLKRP